MEQLKEESEHSRDVPDAGSSVLLLISTRSMRDDCSMAAVRSGSVRAVGVVVR